MGTVRPGEAVAYLIGLFACLPVAACSNGTGPERTPVVQLRVETDTISAGDTLQETLLPFLPPGYVPPVTWSSSDPAVATVGPQTGLVVGIAPGQAVIHAVGTGSPQAQQARDSLRLTVISPP